MIRRTPPVVLVILAALTALLAATSPAASASGAARAYPGMEIRQGATVCTLAFIDVGRRIAYSSGHCATDREVRDSSGRPIGVVAVVEHNRAGHSRTGPSDTIIDYEAIGLYSHVNVTNGIAPTHTRPLIAEPGLKPRPGMKVCHRGVTTGRSCGTIDTVHDGWFRMKADGMTSEDGDSGAPVYTYTDASGTNPVIIGILRGKNGGRVHAVSFPDTLRNAIYAAEEQSS